MGKYDSMKFWKQTISSTFKLGQKCNRPIDMGDIYYCEWFTDPKINFIGKEICIKGYERFK